MSIRSGRATTITVSNRVVFVTNRTTVRRLNFLEIQCKAVAAAHGMRPVFFEHVSDTSVSADRVVALKRCITENEAELVVAAGGDGTVNVCAQAIAESGVAMAVVPNGTANLFARSLGLPFSLSDALAVGFGSHERRIDMAVANGRISLTMAGMGLDAVVIPITPVLLKQYLSWASYVVVGLSQLHAAPHHFEIRLDDGEPMRRTAYSVVVGNVGILPGGFELLPGAQLDDRLIDVGIVAPEGLWGWAQLAGRLLEERIRNKAGGIGLHAGDTYPFGGGGVEHHQASRVEIRAETELCCEVDGEAIGMSRSLNVGVSERTLTVRVGPVL